MTPDVNCKQHSLAESEQLSRLKIRYFQRRKSVRITRRVIPDAIKYVAFSDFWLMSTEPRKYNYNSMRKLLFISFISFISLFLSASINNFAQSRRVSPKTATPATPATDAMNDLTAEQMFVEANTYSKIKFAEFETKKIPFSESLLKRTVLEQKQLAAKYAAAVSTRQNLAGEDFYYLGMLNWLADNSEKAAESFQRFIVTENPVAEKLQTARSIIIVVAARRKNLDEAEKLLVDYLKTEPIKSTERARVESELAKSYRAEKDLAKAGSQAE